MAGGEVEVILNVKAGGNWAAGFLRSQFSEKDGTVSNTRVLQAFIVMHAMGWISALLFLYGWFNYRTHGVITMTDICTFIGAVTTLTVALGGTLGGIKAVNDIANNRAENASAQVQPPEETPKA
jgi:hypothetical protein